MSSVDQSTEVGLLDVEALKSLLAQSEIRSVLERYFYGLDARDEEALKSCFSDDAYYEANTGKGRKISFKGAAEISSTLVRLMGRFEGSLHVTSSPAVIVNGNRATADVFAAANMFFKQPDDSGRIFVRGVRYRDELAKIDGKWLIINRVHTTCWQHNAESVEPFVPPAVGIDK